MSSVNTSKFMALLGNHITNLNCALKGIKSNTFIDFIYCDHHSLIIMSNKVASPSKFSIVENYIKNTHSMNSDNVQTTQFSQFKLYLKVLDISYFIKGTNMLINLSMIKTIIKFTHIFNNIHITSKSCIVKVSPKLNIAIF